MDFPLINDGGASKAVGLSLLICAVIRPAMIVAPIHAASAPAAGTGKSYLRTSLERSPTVTAAPWCSPGKARRNWRKS